MQAIITILTLLLTQSESLPVTSKALESNSDQLIWQTAWFSSQLHDGRDESPFTGEPKKITAKSIFITPNFNENVSHCPPGYKIDDNGKCVKVVNINQGKAKLVSCLRLRHDVADTFKSFLKTIFLRRVCRTSSRNTKRQVTRRALTMTTRQRMKALTSRHITLCR